MSKLKETEKIDDQPKEKFGQVVSHIKSVHGLLDRVGEDINSLKERMKSSTLPSSASDLKQESSPQKSKSKPLKKEIALEAQSVPQFSSAIPKVKKSKRSVSRCSDNLQLSSTFFRSRIISSSNLGSGEGSRFTGKRELSSTLLESAIKKKENVEADKSHSDPEQNQEKVKPKKKKETTSKTAATGKYSHTRKNNLKLTNHNNSRSLTDLHMTASENGLPSDNSQKDKSSITTQKKKSRNRFLEARQSPNGLTVFGQKLKNTKRSQSSLSVSNIIKKKDPKVSHVTIIKPEKEKCATNPAQQVRPASVPVGPRNFSFWLQESEASNCQVDSQIKEAENSELDQYMLNSVSPFAFSSINEVPLFSMDSKNALDSNFSEHPLNTDFSSGRSKGLKTKPNDERSKSKLPRINCSPYVKSTPRSRSSSSLKLKTPRPTSLKAMRNKAATLSRLNSWNHNSNPNVNNFSTVADRTIKRKDNKLPAYPPLTYIDSKNGTYVSSSEESIHETDAVSLKTRDTHQEELDNNDIYFEDEISLTFTKKKLLFQNDLVKDQKVTGSCSKECDLFSTNFPNQTLFKVGNQNPNAEGIQEKCKYSIRPPVTEKSEDTNQNIDDMSQKGNGEDSSPLNIVQTPNDKCQTSLTDNSSQILAMERFYSKSLEYPNEKITGSKRFLNAYDEHLKKIAIESENRLKEIETKSVSRSIGLSSWEWMHRNDKEDIVSSSEDENKYLCKDEDGEECRMKTCGADDELSKVKIIDIVDSLKVPQSSSCHSVADVLLPQCSTPSIKYLIDEFEEKTQPIQCETSPCVFQFADEYLKQIVVEQIEESSEEQATTKQGEETEGYLSAEEFILEEKDCPVNNKEINHVISLLHKTSLQESYLLTKSNAIFKQFCALASKRNCIFDHSAVEVMRFCKKIPLPCYSLKINFLSSLWRKMLKKDLHFELADLTKVLQLDKAWQSNSTCEENDRQISLYDPKYV